MHHDDTHLSDGPPFNIVNREQILERFGAEALAQVLDMAAEGDPLADDAVQALRQAPKAQRGSLEAGIRQGLRSLVGPPEAVRRILADAETMPDWLDKGSLQRGSEAALTIGPLWMSISLGPGSLAHTYSSPTIARVLMATGNLDTSALRRLQETGIWEQQALRPGGLAPCAPGYVHTLQVRMLHARVRAGMLGKGWDTAQLGMPVSQLDMVRTWLDFTYVPFGALEKVGITFTGDELHDLYHLWQWVAHLLGIAPRYYRQAADHASAGRLLALIDAASAGPDENSRQLTQRMLVSLGHILQPALGMPTDVTIDLMHSFCRLFHDEATADALGAKANWTQALLPILADANRHQRHLERSDEAVRQRKIAMTLGYFDQVIQTLEGQTAYQHNIGDMGSAGLTPSIQTDMATAAG